MAFEGNDAGEVMPLDVMLATMRRKWHLGDHDGAASLAKVAAPYVHQRVSAAAQAGRDDGRRAVQELSDAELERIIAAGAAGAGSAGGAADAADDASLAAPLGDGGFGSG